MPLLTNNIVLDPTGPLKAEEGQLLMSLIRLIEKIAPQGRYKDIALTVYLNYMIYANSLIANDRQIFTCTTVKIFKAFVSILKVLVPNTKPTTKLNDHRQRKNCLSLLFGTVLELLKKNPHIEVSKSNNTSFFEICKLLTHLK